MATISLIDADPDLAADLSSHDLALARSALVAATLAVKPGPWDASPLGRRAPGSLGLLVLEGALLRSTTLRGRTTAHLFGSGDLLRPWGDADTVAPIPLAVAWTAITPSVVALIDRRLTALAARWPSILVALARRAAWQTSRVSLQVALTRIPRIEERLLMLFWRLGERWGRMTPAGTLVPLPLTHEVIAMLVAASRPPVSGALSRLSRIGLLTRRPEGWLLARDADALLRSGEAI